MIIIDQYCFAIPLLRCKSNNVVFYCGNKLYWDRFIQMMPVFVQKLLFKILDICMQVTTGMASNIIVNSNHDLRQFMRLHNFISVKDKKKQKQIVSYNEHTILKSHSPHVIYDAVDLEKVNAISASSRGLSTFLPISHQSSEKMVYIGVYVSGRTAIKQIKHALEVFN
jgi:hypothetical protein